MAPDRDSLEPEENHVHDGPDVEHGDPDLDIGLDDETDASEESDEADGGSESGPPGKLESWRKRSATGAVLTGLALGFQQVFEKEREEPAIIMTTSGDPPRDLPVEAEVEHGRPRRAVVNIRPWLLDRGGSGAAPDDSTDSDPATDAPARRDQPPEGD